MRGDGVRVLVVGAGIAGLAAARTLRDWGAVVHVVEHSEHAPQHGMGIYLPGNAFRALDTLGFANAMADRAVHIYRQRTADHRGRTLIEVDVDELWNGVGPCLALHRGDLHSVLLAGIGDIPVRWGHRPDAITVGADAVTVTVNGVSAGYNLVVGADGVHSTVRQLVFGSGAVRSVGQWAHRFVVPWAGRLDSWSVFLGSGSALLAMPIGNGQVYCYCDGPLQGSRALREVLAGYAEPVPALLDALDAVGGGSTVQAGPIEEVALASWSKGAVLLVGDAAHATSPNMAQGAAMALEDAIVLAESLVAAPDLRIALATFELRRRPRTDWIRTQTHRRDRFRRLPPRLRNVVLRMVGARVFRANYRPLREPP